MSGSRRDFMRTVGAGIGAAALARVSATFAQIGAGRLIVVSNGGGENIPTSMTLIDADTLQVISTLSAPMSFSFPATRWASARDIIWGGVAEKVAGISLATGAEVATFPTASRQNYTELTPDGRYVIVAARYEDKIYKADASPDVANDARLVEVADHEPGVEPCDMTMLADGSFVFTPDRFGETVSVFSVNPLAKVATLPLERRGEEQLEPFMATVSPRGDLLLVENARGEGSESVIDVSNPRNPSEIARFDQADGLGVSPLTSEISPDGRFGMVLCRGSSEITVIDMDAVAVRGRVALPEGGNPIAGTFTPDGNRLFVPLPGRDAVAVVAVPSFEVEALLAVGTRPLGAVYLESPVPERQGMVTPIGAAFASARQWPTNCPDRCCGVV